MFDLILCNHMPNGKNYLFTAPFNYLSVGDKVIVDTINGEKIARVKGILTVSNNDDPKIRFVMEAAGAKMPLKRVLYKARKLTMEE